MTKPKNSTPMSKAEAGALGGKRKAANRNWDPYSSDGSARNSSAQAPATPAARAPAIPSTRVKKPARKRPADPLSHLFGEDGDDDSDEDAPKPVTKKIKKEPSSPQPESSKASSAKPNSSRPDTTSSKGGSARPELSKAEFEAEKVDLGTGRKPGYLPRAIVAVKKEADIQKLPIIFLANGTPYELSNVASNALDETNFWHQIRKRYEGVAQTFDDRTFGTELDQSLVDASVLSQHLFPSLHTQEGLRARALSKAPMGQQIFKSFLTNIIKHATELKDKYGGKKDVAPEADRLIATLAGQLMSSTQTPTIPTEEHLHLMSVQSQLLHGQGEQMRRELVAYSAIVSSVAEKTRREKHEVNMVAEWILANLGDKCVKKEEDEEFSDVIDWEPGTTSDKGKGKQVEESDVLPTTEVSKATKAFPPLPELFIRPAGKDAHWCRCPNCDENAVQDFLDEAKKQLIQDKTELLTATAQQEVIAKVKESYLPEATEVAKTELLEELKAKEHSGQAKKEKDELLAQITKETTTNLRKELEPVVIQQLRKEMMEKMGMIEKMSNPGTGGSS
ncbi:hypothetical protein P7C71_g923, partial [Lecanoromycetidae sp. Uapishka_2]